ncbi:hypothetical protein SDJN03_28753, partial [Cucurbita argyrosperma subsp. sororia]
MATNNHNDDLQLSLALRTAAAATVDAASERHLIILMRTVNNLEFHRRSLHHMKSQTPRETGPIEPPYPWSTNQRAVVHTLNYMTSNQILTITGDVKCHHCQRIYKIEYDIVSKFNEIGSFVENNMESLQDRTPRSWIWPDYPTCRFCGTEKGVRPVIPKECEKINWVFLLLGEMNISISLNKTRYFVELLYQIIPHVVTFFALVAFDVARDCEDAVRSKVGEFVDYGSTSCGPWIRCESVDGVIVNWSGGDGDGERNWGGGDGGWREGGGDSGQRVGSGDSGQRVGGGDGRRRESLSSRSIGVLFSRFVIENYWRIVTDTNKLS